MLKDGVKLSKAKISKFKTNIRLISILTLVINIKIAKIKTSFLINWNM